MSTTDGYMPIARCPGCNNEWQWDDYYDVCVGSQRECPNCGAIVEVLRTDTMVYCQFGLALGKTGDRNGD